MSSLRDRRRRRKEEEENEEKEKERDEFNVPIFGGKPRIFEQRGGFDGIRKLLLSEEEKDKKHQREQKVTTKEEEEEDKGKEAEKKDDDSDVNTTNTNDDENHSDVFIAYEKHLTKSQQHQARLRRQSEASAERLPTGVAQSRRGSVADHRAEGERDGVSRSRVVEIVSSTGDEVYGETVERWSQETGGDFGVHH